VVEEGLVHTCGATWCSWMQGKRKGARWLMVKLTSSPIRSQGGEML